jgi:3D (Asp-Asp-Asp) domain-containing protein
MVQTFGINVFIGRKEHAMIARKILIMCAGVMVLSGSAAAYAQTNTETLQNIQQELQQKAQEKQAVNQDIQNIQQEISSLNTYISENQAAMEKTQQKMNVTNQLIEQKREEIVTLEDKILNRKEVMKNRLLALQHDDNLSLVIKVFLDSKNFNDFIQRASAVSALFSADQDILKAQQNDLKEIEVAKKEIDRQEQILEGEQQTLSKQQQELASNMQQRQATLSSLQEKFSQIDTQMALAEQQKSDIMSQIQAAQEKLRQQQAAAAARAASPQDQNTSAPAGNGQEMYVTATAYSPEESGAVTSLGYNIKNNPNMKLIAVDPSVIPLGKKVWVEGYGTAIAGDTGGAIKGYKIDVLVPSKADAAAWGRRTVKIIILD